MLVEVTETSGASELVPPCSAFGDDWTDSTESSLSNRWLG